MRYFVMLAALSLAISATAFEAVAQTSDQPLEPLRFYSSDIVRPNPNLDFIEKTRKAIEEAVGRRVLYIEKSEAELEKDFRRDQVDIAFSSAGAYRVLSDKSVIGIASMCTPEATDPDVSTAALIVTLESRQDLSTWSDLKGKRIGADHPDSFQGDLIVRREFARQGLDPDHYAQSVYFGDDPARQLEALRAEEIDAAVLPACYAEKQRVFNHTDILKGLKVVGERAGWINCRMSTSLYPGFTLFLHTSRLSGPEIKNIVSAVYSINHEANGRGWGIVSDYEPAEDVYQVLERGAYRRAPLTLTSIWHEYGRMILIGFAILLLWGAFTFYVVHLVKKRTALAAAALEEEVRLTQEMQQVNERFGKAQKALIVSQMSSMVSHELGQPLSAISLYAGSLADLIENSPGIPAECSQNMADAVEQIHNCAKRANTIIENVRAYAKSGDKPRSRQDVMQIVRKATAQFIRRHALPVGTIVTEAMATEFFVIGNALELELAFDNLLKNSLDAGTGDRELRIYIRSQTTQAGALRLEFADNGNQVDDALLARINAPLNSSKSGGLGLGLSIVRSIIQSHQGQMTSSKSVHGGLLIVIELPAQ